MTLSSPEVAQEATVPKQDVFEQYARDMSKALGPLLRGGGSEWFTKIGDESYICPKLAGAELQRAKTEAIVTKKALFKLKSETVPKHVADKLAEAASRIAKVVEMAGASNLSNGVQLGPVSWLVKMNDALEQTRLAIKEYQEQHND
jgi:hypothetical protein